MSSRHGISLVAGLGLIAALWGTGVSAVAAEPPTRCSDYLSAESARQFESAGLTIVDEAPEGNFGHLYCFWTGESGSIQLSYLPVSEAEQREFETGYRESGYEPQSSEVGTLLSNGAGDVAYFREGYLTMASGAVADLPPLFTMTRADLAQQLVAVILGEDIETGSPAGPLSCEELLTSELARNLETAGWVLIEGLDRGAEFTGRGGSYCVWGVPFSDQFATFAYSPITAEDAVDNQTRLVGEGFASTIIDERVALERTTGELAIEEVYLFEEGVWYYADSGLDSAIELADRIGPILAARAAVEEDGAESAGPTESNTLAADEPSTLRALPTAAEITPTRLAGGVAVAVVLAALVGLPGKLLESALGAHGEQFARWTAPLRRRSGDIVARIRPALARVPAWAGIAVGLVVSAIVAGFIDPRFGFSGGSLRLFLSLLAGFVIEGLLGMLLLRWMLRRHGVESTVHFKAASLLIVLAAVVVTRVTGFQPGLVFGVLLALTATTALSAALERRSAFVELGWLLGLGLVSWGLYSAIAPVASGVVPLFFTELFAGLTVGCLAALPLVMLPLSGMPGQALYRSVGLVRWAALYAVGAIAFLAIVLPFPSSWERVDGAFVTWIAFYVVYAVIAVAVWAALTYLPRREPQKQP